MSYQQHGQFSGNTPNNYNNYSQQQDQPAYGYTYPQYGQPSQTPAYGPPSQYATHPNGQIEPAYQTPQQSQLYARAYSQYYTPPQYSLQDLDQLQHSATPAPPQRQPQQQTQNGGMGMGPGGYNAIGASQSGKYDGEYHTWQNQSAASATYATAEHLGQPPQSLYQPGQHNAPRAPSPLHTTTSSMPLSSMTNAPGSPFIHHPHSAIASPQLNTRLPSPAQPPRRPSVRQSPQIQQLPDPRKTAPSTRPLPENQSPYPAQPIYDGESQDLNTAPDHGAYQPNMPQPKESTSKSAHPSPLLRQQQAQLQSQLQTELSAPPITIEPLHRLSQLPQPSTVSLSQIETRPPPATISLAQIENRPSQFATVSLSQLESRPQHLPEPTAESISQPKETPKIISKTAPKRAPENVTYDMLLLSLSDEYVDAAYQLGPRVALLGQTQDVDMYNGLMAAGLGCLEATLKNFTFRPRLEAAITFRYASLMYDETENHEQLERILSKSLLLCERNKLHDFKYSIHHLQARATFRKNPKAALKALDTQLHEVEGFKNIPWTYALRLLRVTLSLQLPHNQEINHAITHIKALILTAEKNSDFALIVAFSTLEALIHLRSESSEFVMNCQEAIAKARRYQLRKGTENISKIWAILHCADLTCALIECQDNQAQMKAKMMQSCFDELLQDDSNWVDGTAIFVPLGKESEKQLADVSSNIFQRAKDGQLGLSLQWLDKSGAHALASLLIVCSSLLKSTVDSKTLKRVDDGLNALQDSFSNKALAAAEFGFLPASKVDIQSRLTSNALLMWYLQLYEAFIFCINTKWKAAQKLLNELDSQLHSGNFADLSSLSRWVIYLRGVIEQGTGNGESAAQIFRSPLLMTPSRSTNPANKRISSAFDDISALSRISLIFLLRSPDHPPNNEAQELLSDLQRMVPSSHPNPMLRAAVSYVSAVINPHEQIIVMKTALGNVLSAIRDKGNAQLMAIAMSALVSIFFADITVGQQALSGRKAACSLAQRAGDPLWMAVADGMALRGELQPAEREQKRKQLDSAIERLDENVKRRFVVQSDDMNES